MKLVVFLRLIRLKNLLLICYVFLLINYFLFPAIEINKFLSTFQFVILLLATICITASGYIINDIFDIDSDKINKPNKMVVGKSISIEKAKKLYLYINTIGIVLGIGLCLQIEKPNLVFIFIAAPLLLFYYSKKIQRIPLIGNILISLLISFSIYMLVLFENNSANNSVYYIIFVLCIFSFLINLAREIVKDIIDVKGDFNQGLKTLPIVLGIQRSSIITALFTIATMLLLVFLIVSVTVDFKITKLFLLITCVIPLAYATAKLIKKPSSKTFNTVSLLLKLIMFFGISSIILISYNL